MLQGVTVLGERKYRVGVTSAFEWSAPAPISGAPVGTVKLPSGDVALGLAAVHAPLSVTGFAASEGESREMTIVATTNTDGLQGRYGDAWLVTPHDGAFQVRISRVDGTTCFLADPLNRSISVSPSDPAVLQFATYTGTIAAAGVAAALARNVAWEVAYDAQYGTNTPALTGARDFGLLHIVNQPFTTGLTSGMVTKHVQHMGERIPRGKQGWEGEIEQAEEELILAIRQELAPISYTEDDIPVAAQLRIAHLSYTLAVIFDLTELETSEKLRAQATTRMRSALRLIWVDSSNDGVPDDGEVQQVTRSRTSWASGGSPTSATYTRPFSIGQRH